MNGFLNVSLKKFNLYFNLSYNNQVRNFKNQIIFLLNYFYIKLT